MSATPQDVQAKLDQAIGEFVKITSVPSKLAAKYGTDPTKWPAGHAQNVGDLIAAARTEAGQLVAPAAPTPTPTPTPVPSGTAKYDKRASICTEISSTGWDYSLPSPGVHNLVQTFNGDPATSTPFSSLDYTHDDISLLADARYGKVWRIKCGPTSHNPWTPHQTTNSFWYYTHNSNLGYARQWYVDQGAPSWDWWAFAVRYDTGYESAMPDGSLVMEVGYQHISSPPFQMGLDGPNFAAKLQTGKWPGSYPFPYVNHVPVRSYSSIAGEWLEVICGVYWSSHNNGQVIVKTRLPSAGESSFRTDVNLSGINTWSWGTGANGITVPQDPGPGGYRADELWGQYEWWGGSKTFHDPNFPQHDLSLYGWVCCPTETDARSFLPA